MHKELQNLIAAIDVGSAKTCAVVAETTESGPRYLGHGVADSRGSRKGAIVAVDKARSIGVPPEWQIMHLLPQEFLLDDHNSIRDPAGMLGSKLEVQVHVVTAIGTITQNVVTTLNRAGIHVDDT